jgi:hypothetical protein
LLLSSEILRYAFSGDFYVFICFYKFVEISLVVSSRSNTAPVTSLVLGYFGYTFPGTVDVRRTAAVH